MVVLATPTIGVAEGDTLRFHSAAFGTERTVVVHVPEFHHYASAEVGMPVIILLDGQHDWFIDPLLNDIRFLQYTHEVPQAIVVTVPHEDRVQECAPDSIDQPGMPLLEMLTQELPPLLRSYHPGEITVLVGHSFTASFALYAYLRAPDAFDAVIALSPLHQVNRSVPLVVDRLVERLDQRVLVAVGGAERLKDGGHHATLVPAVPAASHERTEGRFLFRAYPAAGHTAVPIIAFPDLLATLFKPYALRDSLAPVDDEYRILDTPPAAQDLLRAVEASHRFLGGSIPWNLDEINGLASRLGNSGHTEQVKAILERALQLYPEYYAFHAWYGELVLPTDATTGEAAIRTALELLERHERDDPDYAAMREEVLDLLK